MSEMDVRCSPGGSTGEAVQCQEVDSFLPQNSCRCQHSTYVKHKRKRHNRKHEENHRATAASTERPWWQMKSLMNCLPSGNDSKERSSTPQTGDGVHSPSFHQCPHALRNTGKLLVHRSPFLVLVHKNHLLVLLRLELRSKTILANKTRVVYRTTLGSHKVVH